MATTQFVTLTQIDKSSNATWTGAQTFSPSSGGVIINAAANQQALLITSNTSGTTAALDVEINRAGSTANLIGRGPGIQIEDTTAVTASAFQHSGGQTEIWQYNGSWVQLMYATPTQIVTFPGTVKFPGNTNGITSLSASGIVVSFGTFVLANTAEITVHDSPFVVGTNAPQDFSLVTTAVKRFTVTAGGTIHANSIGTTANAVNAYFDPNANNSLLRNSSSLRYKTNVEPLWANVSNKVLELNPVWFRSNTETTVDPAHISFIGLIAEDVANVEPRLVHWIRKDLNDANSEFIPEGVQYPVIGVMLIDIVKRQEARIKALEDALSKLNTQG